MRASRFVLFAVTALVVAIFYFPLGHDDFLGRWGDATYGLVMSRSAALQVVDVLPGSPAQAAGVRAGDSVVARSFTPQWSAIVNPRAGDRGTFLLRRSGGTFYSVRMRAMAVPGFTWWSRIGGILGCIPATIFLAIAFVLVFARPSVMTWSFYAYAVGYFSTAASYQYFSQALPPDAYIALTFLLATALGNFAVMPLLPFVLRFPNDHVDPALRGVDRAIWVIIGVSFVAYAYEWYHLWLTGRHASYVDLIDSWLPLAVFAAATLIFVKRYKHAPPDVRQRFGFLVLGLFVSFVAYSVYFIPNVSAAVAQISGYAVVLMPVCVAYAVLRHRVLDINFVLNRAIAYGTLSVLVIAFVSFLDWSLGRLVSIERLATGIELMVTIAIGFLLDRINRVIESFVESVLFRGRRIAEGYLKRAAAALPYATDEPAISDSLTQVPADGLKLSAAALYRRSIDETRFEGIATSLETSIAPASFDRNHLLVRILQSSEKRVWLDEVRTHLDPDNAAIYVLAIPVSVRHEIVAFTLYGAHKNGSQLDPEEIELLEELAREASRAYDHVESVRVREHYARLATAT